MANTTVGLLSVSGDSLPMDSCRAIHRRQFNPQGDWAFLDPVRRSVFEVVLGKAAPR